MIQSTNTNGIQFKTPFRPVRYFLRYRKVGTQSWAINSFDNDLERSGYMSCINDHMFNIEMECVQADVSDTSIWPSN